MKRTCDVKPKEGAVARALEDALAPLKWRFERPHHEIAPGAAPGLPSTAEKTPLTPLLLQARPV